MADATPPSPGGSSGAGSGASIARAASPRTALFRELQQNQLRALDVVLLNINDDRAQKRIRAEFEAHKRVMPRDLFVGLILDLLPERLTLRSPIRAAASPEDVVLDSEVNLSDAQRRALVYNIFEMLDTDGDGTVDWKEMSAFVLQQSAVITDQDFTIASVLPYQPAAQVAASNADPSANLVSTDTNPVITTLRAKDRLRDIFSVAGAELDDRLDTRDFTDVLKPKTAKDLADGMRALKEEEARRRRLHLLRGADAARRPAPSTAVVGGEVDGDASATAAGHGGSGGTNGAPLTGIAGMPGAKSIPGVARILREGIHGPLKARPGAASSATGRANGRAAESAKSATLGRSAAGSSAGVGRTVKLAGRTIGAGGAGGGGKGGGAGSGDGSNPGPSTRNGVGLVQYLPGMDLLACVESRSTGVQLLRFTGGGTGFELVSTLKGQGGVVEAVESFWSVAPGVGAMVYRPYLLTAAANSTIALWDMNPGHKQYSLVSSWPTAVSQQCLCYCDRYNILFSGSSGRGTLYTWNVKTGQQLIAMPGHADITTALVQIPTQDRLASCSHDQTVRLWDMTTGDCDLVLRGHRRGIVSMALHDQRSLLVTAAYDHDAMVWSPQGTSPILTLSGHSTPLIGVRTVPGTPEVITASIDGQVRIWDLRRPRQPIHSFLVREESGFEDSGAEGEDSVSHLRTFDLCLRPQHGSTDGKHVFAPPAYLFSKPTAPPSSATGATATAAAGGGSSAATPTAITPAPTSAATPSATTAVAATSAGTSASASASASASTSGGGAASPAPVGAKGAAAVSTLLGGKTGGVGALLAAAAASAASTAASTVSSPTPAPAALTSPSASAPPANPLADPASSADAGVTADPSTQRPMLQQLVFGIKSLQVFSQQQTPELLLKTDTEPVAAVGFSPLHGTVLTASNRTVKVWSSLVGVLLRVFRDMAPAPITCLVMERRGVTFAIGCEDGSVSIHNAMSGHLTRRLTPHVGDVTALAWLDRRLVSVGWDRRVLVHSEVESKGANPDNAAEVGTAGTSHRTDISCVDVEATHGIVASGSVDGEIRVFQAYTGHLEACLHHAAALTAIRFLPAEHTMASADTTGTVIFWALRAAGSSFLPLAAFRHAPLRWLDRTGAASSAAGSMKKILFRRKKERRQQARKEARRRGEVVSDSDDESDNEGKRPSPKGASPTGRRPSLGSVFTQDSASVTSELLDERLREFDGEAAEGIIDPRERAEAAHSYVVAMEFDDDTSCLYTVDDEGRVTGWNLRRLLTAFEVHVLRATRAIGGSTQVRRRHSISMSADEIDKSEHSSFGIGGSAPGVVAGVVGAAAPPGAGASTGSARAGLAGMVASGSGKSGEPPSGGGGGGGLMSRLAAARKGAGGGGAGGAGGAGGGVVMTLADSGGMDPARQAVLAEDIGAMYVSAPALLDMMWTALTHDAACTSIALIKNPSMPLYVLSGGFDNAARATFASDGEPAGILCQQLSPHGSNPRWLVRVDADSWRRAARDRDARAAKLALKAQEVFRASLTAAPPAPRTDSDDATPSPAASRSRFGARKPGGLTGAIVADGGVEPASPALARSGAGVGVSVSAGGVAGLGGGSVGGVGVGRAGDGADRSRGASVPGGPSSKASMYLPDASSELSSIPSVPSLDSESAWLSSSHASDAKAGSMPSAATVRRSALPHSPIRTRKPGANATEGGAAPSMTSSLPHSRSSGALLAGSRSATGLGAAGASGSVVTGPPSVSGSSSSLPFGGGHAMGALFGGLSGGARGADRGGGGGGFGVGFASEGDGGGTSGRMEDEPPLPTDLRFSRIPLVEAPKRDRVAHALFYMLQEPEEEDITDAAERAERERRLRRAQRSSMTEMVGDLVKARAAEKMAAEASTEERRAKLSRAAPGRDTQSAASKTAGGSGGGSASGRALRTGGLATLTSGTASAATLPGRK